MYAERGRVRLVGGPMGTGGNVGRQPQRAPSVGSRLLRMDAVRGRQALRVHDRRPRRRSDLVGNVAPGPAHGPVVGRDGAARLRAAVFAPHGHLAREQVHVHTGQSADGAADEDDVLEWRQHVRAVSVHVAAAGRRPEDGYVGPAGQTPRRQISAVLPVAACLTNDECWTTTFTRLLYPLSTSSTHQRTCCTHRIIIFYCIFIFYTARRIFNRFHIPVVHRLTCVKHTFVKLYRDFVKI